MAARLIKSWLSKEFLNQKDMKKKEYTKPEMQVVNITSCALLAASTLYQGRAESSSSPAKDDDDWYYGD